MEPKPQIAERQQPIRERTLTFKRIFLPTWQPTPEQLLWIIRFAVILVFLGLLVVIGYHFEWTGFGDSVRDVGKDKDLRRAKTLWDWMQLLVVPAALAIGGFLLANRAQKQRDKENEDAQNQRDKENSEAQERRDLENEERRQQELFLEQQRAQDAALQSYLDQMSHLILEKQLFATQPNDVHRTLARARTLTVLERLDAGRKRNVLRFLHESGLIKGDNPIIVLRGAKNLFMGVDLSGAQLTEANLAGADLEGADLRHASLATANLTGASLRNADLTDAELTDAEMSRADLTGAKVTGEQLGTPNSLEGATMPDGSKHP